MSDKRIAEHVDAKMTEMLEYIDSGNTWDDEWFRNHLIDLGNTVADDYRAKVTKPNRSRMTAQERFEYDNPEFEGW